MHGDSQYHFRVDSLLACLPLKPPFWPMIFSPPRVTLTEVIMKTLYGQILKAMRRYCPHDRNPNRMFL